VPAGAAESWLLNAGTGTAERATNVALPGRTGLRSRSAARTRLALFHRSNYWKSSDPGSPSALDAYLSRPRAGGGSEPMEKCGQSDAASSDGRCARNRAQRPI
jgi:hypothetical protein